jgi:hypothetical protein
MRLLLVPAFCALLAFTPPAAAQVAGAFSAGRSELSITGGSGYAFNDSYLILGVGAAFYVLDGLNIGLSTQGWFGGTPRIYNVTPSVEYVFYQPATVKPYVGAFYRRTFIDGLPDLDSTGLRAGFYVQSGNRNYFGFGLVHQEFSDCNKNTYIKCDSNYLEVSFKFTL